MNVYVFDVSSNSSPQKIRSAARSAGSADRIFAFDNRLYEYRSAEALIRDIDHDRSLFCKPAAYYDSIIAVCSKVRREGRKAVITVISSGEDDCSCFSDKDYYNDYRYHLMHYYPIELTTYRGRPLDAVSEQRQMGFWEALKEYWVFREDDGLEYSEDYDLEDDVP